MSLPRISWRTTEPVAKLYFSSRTRYWTHCIGRTNVLGCIWQAWCCWERYLKCTMFLSSKKSTVSHHSSIGTVAIFPLTMFQLFTMTLLPLLIRSPAICRLSIGCWLKGFVYFCILQTLLVVKSTVSSSSIMNRWFQNHYSPIPAFAVSTRYMQLFVSSKSDKKKLQEFTMLMYFQS